MDYMTASFEERMHRLQLAQAGVTLRHGIAMGAEFIRQEKAKTAHLEHVASKAQFEAAIQSMAYQREELALELSKDGVQRHKQMKRPCMTLGVQVSAQRKLDGATFYVARWTELEAEGDSPEQACANFDRMWVGGNDEL